MTGAHLTRLVNVVLAEHGLRWCSRCAPVAAHAAAMRRIVETGRFRPRRSIQPLSEFAVVGGRVSPWCRACKAQYQRQLANGRDAEVRRLESAARYERTKQDPDRLAARRAVEREYQRRRRLKAKRDPELAARMAANQRRYRERVLADPVRHQEFKDHRRIDYRLRMEQQGRPLTLGERAPEDLPLPVVPVEPFARWLDQQQVGPAEISARTGVPERRLLSMRKREQEWVAVDTVDRVLVRLGSPAMFHELYPAVPLTVSVTLASDAAFAGAGR